MNVRRRDDIHHDPPADEVALETCAVLDAFAALPAPQAHLGEWMRRYPEQAVALADLALALTEEDAAIEQAPDADVATHGVLSSGTQRTLDQIFDTPSGRMVAEEPGHYRATPTERD